MDCASASVPVAVVVDLEVSSGNDLIEEIDEDILGRLIPVAIQVKKTQRPQFSFHARESIGKQPLHRDNNILRLEFRCGASDRFHRRGARPVCPS